MIPRQSRPLLLFACALVLTAPAALAQPQPAEASLGERIDAFLVAAYPEETGPGAALLVIDDGEVVYRGARGMADVELGVSLEPDHVFRLGSITKQFTGVAIMILEEEGKLSVSDPITDFLPDYPTHGHTITIEHLLTHTSGIYNYTNVPGFMDEPVRQDVTTEELVDSFKGFAMDFAPGERWNYSNSGYVLLGAIIEEVSGQSYADFVRERIFEPLGMDNSYYGGHQIIPGRVKGYSAEGEGYVNAGYISMTQPHAAGSLLSTVDDLATWHRALAGGELISAESYERMTTPFVLNDGEATTYGYGFTVQDVRGRNAVMHGGGIHGFVTLAAYFPDEGIYVAALSNIPGVGFGPGQLALKAAALTFGDPFPEFEPIEVPSDILERYVGVYRIDDNNTRTVTLEDGKLYTQRTGGARLEVIPHSENGFYYEQAMTHFEIVTDESGAVSHMLMYHDGASEAERADFTDEEIPTREEADVDSATYDRYVGKYVLAPSFVLTVTREGDRLFTQATGQSKVEIFPESETRFFLKVVDAQLEFEVDGDGPAPSVTLFQGGQTIKGKRID